MSSNKNSQKDDTQKRPKYVVYVDERFTMTPAVYYAAVKAKSLKGDILMLHVAKPVEADMRISASVEAAMADEIREKAEKNLKDLKEEIKKKVRKAPQLAIRLGQPQTELFNLIAEDDDINHIVLGTSINGTGIHSFLSGTSKKLDEIKVPITIIPETLDRDEIDELYEVLI